MTVLWIQNQESQYEIFAPNCASSIYCSQHYASSVSVPQWGNHYYVPSLGGFASCESHSKPRKIGEETFCLFPTHKLWIDSWSFAAEVKHCLSWSHWQHSLEHLWIQDLLQIFNTLFGTVQFHHLCLVIVPECHVTHLPIIRTLVFLHQRMQLHQNQNVL